MGTFGDKLKREREMRAISLEEIAEATKIGTRSLRALEEERFDQLPGGIFNKGFVRAYAKYLGLDEEQLVADYLVASKEQPEGNISLTELSKQMEAARERERDEERRRRRTHPLIKTLVVIVVVIGAGYGGRYWYQQRKAARAAQNEAVENAVKPNAQPPAPVPTENVNTAQPAAVPTTQSPKIEQPPIALPITLTLKATGRTWISVTADGKLIAEETLDGSDPKLSERTFQAQRKLVLILGNPGGVQVAFNGKAVESLGPAGQRQSLTFTPEGLQKEVSQ